jgi:Tfp pilus assembly protein PilN
MSILINLLPDIRQAKLRDRHRRQLFTGVSLLIWAVCGGVVLVLGLYAAGQAVVIKSVTSQISNRESQLQNVPGLTTALTAEQHLASLSTLYQQRVYVSQFFTAYEAADPTGVTANSLTIDSSNNLVVDGTGTTYTAIATLARAMEKANVSSGSAGTTTDSPAFSEVSIVNVSNATGGVSGGTGGISYTIDAVINSGVVSGSN